MRIVLRWTAILIGILVGLALFAYAVVYALSERELDRAHPFKAAALSFPTDPASIDEGRRLATIRGCVDGCHGKGVSGAVFFDEALVGRLVAPNLTASARRYSDGELAAIIRTGVRPDGHSMMIMPSEAYAYLSDRDVGLIVAFLKAAPAVAGPGPQIELGPAGRAAIATGKFKPAATLIAEAAAPPEAANEQAEFGRYLARTICAGCHGTRLTGDSNPDFTSPSLAIVASYSPEALATLLRTGVGLGDRKLRWMGEMARLHFHLLNDAEIGALHAYLHALPASAPQ